MPLSQGDRLGQFEIIAPLGAGGMGEVYRAVDPRLDRHVALKVLPDALASDADHLLRFQREAKALAALNHPNIATIYGIEANAIVMELVEGQSLAGRSPLPVDETLLIARQIADALEAAHEKGIVHRDLKPGNIMLTPEGVVKILDFGLVKNVETPASTATLSPHSPTLTVRATQAGVILGTASYMSPEQAAGKPVDRRSDIWSFGVLLYEMLTGTCLFEAETLSETLADVLRAEIDLSKLPAATPPAIRELVARCLERKLRNRLPWIGEARQIIERVLALPNPVAPPPAPAGSVFAWKLLAALAVASAGLAWFAFRPHPPALKPLVRFTENLGSGVSILNLAGPTPSAGPAVVISADGSRIAFVNSHEGRSLLFTRRLEQSVATPIPGTEGASGPFFSPNGEWIGFFARGRLKKVALSGGTPIDLCGADAPISATWGDGGFLVATLNTRGPLMRVPESGGAPQPITTLQPGEDSHRWPQVLPGSKVLLYSAGVGGRFNHGSLVAQRLDTGERKVLLTEAHFGRYLPSGHLLFFSGGTLKATRFDLNRLELTSPPVPLFTDVGHGFDTGGAQMSLSDEGTMLYRTGAADIAGRTLNWIYADGRIEPLDLPAGMYSSPTISPDGTRAVYRAMELNRSTVWVYDFARKLNRRVTFEPGFHSTPLWTPDATHIVYAGPDGMYLVRADGVGKPVRFSTVASPLWFTPDGSRLAYAIPLNQPSPQGCLVAPFAITSGQPSLGKPEPCLDSPLMSASELSPDGRWLVYSTFEIGEVQAFVSPFPDRGGRWQVSLDGGVTPRWSRDGKQVFFVNRDGRLMVAPIEVKGDSVVPGTPRVFLDKHSLPVVVTLNYYSPGPGGKRVLVLLDTATGNAPINATVNVVLNLFDEVTRRVRQGN